jgi:hypothetical protein
MGRYQLCFNKGRRCGEEKTRVRRVDAAFAGALKLHFLYDVGVCDRMMAPTAVFMRFGRCDFDLRLVKECT